MKCPKCGCEKSAKYGKARGKQRFKCSSCGYQFTLETVKARTLDEKWFAMNFLASGLSMSAVAQILGVSVQTISRWKKSGQISSDETIKALRIRKISKTGKVTLVKNNQQQEPEFDDFEYGDIFALETRLPSGVRIDIVVKRKASPKPAGK